MASQEAAQLITLAELRLMLLDATAVILLPSGG
jgi:hypothetical protein